MCLDLFYSLLPNNKVTRSGNKKKKREKQKKNLYTAMFKPVDFTGSLNPTLDMPVYLTNMKVKNGLVQIPEATSDSDCSFHSCMEEEEEEIEEVEERQREKAATPNSYFMENSIFDSPRESRKLAQQLKRLTLSTQSAPSTPGISGQDRVIARSPLSVSPTDVSCPGYSSFAEAQSSILMGDGGYPYGDDVTGSSRRLSRALNQGSRSCRVSPNLRSRPAFQMGNSGWPVTGGSPDRRRRSDSISIGCSASGNRTYNEKSFRSRPCSLSGPSGSGRTSRGSVSKRRSYSGFSLSEIKSTLRDLSQTYGEDDYWPISTKSLSDAGDA